MSPRAPCWLLALCVCACAPESPADAARESEAGHPAQPDGRADAGIAEQAGASPATLPTPMLNPEVILTSGCAVDTQQSSLLPANILFVIDRSGSMRCNPPPTTSSEACELEPIRADPDTPSKWELTTQALLAALEALPETTKVGVSYFSNDDACGVYSIPSVPLSRNTPAQRSIIRSSLMGTTPNGPTPLVGATVLAYQHMHQAALAGQISGNKYVVLITDGQQSEMCSDPSRCNGARECTDLLVNTEVPKALADGVNIRTFVVGVPGSEGARTVLSQIAQSGGTAPPNCDVSQGNCHYDMTREPDLGAGLQRALLKIGGQTLTCELALPTGSADNPVDQDRVNVVFTPHEGKARVLPQDTHADCDNGADGWQYSASGDLIRLCGMTCTTVRSDHGGRIDVVLGCPVVGPD